MIKVNLALNRFKMSLKYVYLLIAIIETLAVDVLMFIIYLTNNTHIPMSNFFSLFLFLLNYNFNHILDTFIS